MILIWEKVHKLGIIPRYRCQVSEYSQDWPWGVAANTISSLRRNTALDGQGVTTVNKSMRLKLVVVMLQYRVTQVAR